MDRYAFAAAKASFDPVEVEKGYKELYAERKRFTEYFTPQRILSMELDDYVEGKGAKGLTNFCYAVEWAFDKLGKIQGSTSIKFGIYYSPKKHKYIFARKYGKDIDSAFEKIKSEIVSLIEAGANNDIEAIVSNSLSPMFKGKILFLYYPERYLNIFSEEHIDHYITELGCDKVGSSKLDVVEKRELLLDFKAHDKDMKDWSIHMFARFLYGEYPKSPNEYKEKHEEKFELLKKTEFVDLDYLVNKHIATPAKSSAKKIDYEAKQRSAKRIGNRGENIVLEAEEKWLKQHGIKKKPVYVANTDDSKGYDIESWFEDGSPKYIEVKATRSSIGDDSFFLSINEYLTAKMLGKSYCIYLVLEATTANPKIVKLGNPFISKIKEEDMSPITYRVDIKTLNK